MSKSTESFLESSTKILAFLFLLSISYYLSFWTHFDVNIFQYIAIEDITKGIAYPLRFAGFWILIFAMAFVLLIYAIIIADGAKNDKKQMLLKSTDQARKFIAILFIATVSASFVFYFLPEVTFIGIAIAFALSIFLMGIYYVIDDNRDEKSVSLLDELIEPSMIYCAIFLMINSIVAGISDANKIQKQIEYNYVLQVDLVGKVKTDAPYLVLLGAVSDKYIFVDRAGFEKFVVDKSELPSLKFHHYNRKDDASMEHMNNILELSRLKPKQPMLKIGMPLSPPDSLIQE